MPLIRRKHLNLALILIVIIILHSILGMVFPFAVRYLFNEIVPLKIKRFIPFFLILVLSSFILKELLYILKEKLSISLANRVIGSIRTTLFKKTLETPVSSIEIQGKIIPSFLSNDLHILYETIQTGIIHGVASIIMAFCFFIALFVINSRIAFVFLLTVPFFFFFFFNLHKTIKKRALIIRNSIAKLDAFFNETISMLSTIKIYGFESFFLSKHKRLNNALSQNMSLQKHNQSIFMSLASSCIMVSFSLSLGYGAFLSIKGEMTSGDLLACYILLQGLFQPLMAFFFALRSIQTGVAIIEKTRQYLNFTKTNVTTYPVYTSNKIYKKGLAIQIVDLHFDYNGIPILKGINLEIAKGERVIVKGANGSGKTTLIKILLGFLNFNHGEIFLFGKNIKQYTQKELSHIFSTVEQNKYVFSGSFRQNLDPFKTIKAREINELLSKFHLSQLISRRPLISENGANLSDGEKQRVALLRSLLKKAPVYIWDEALSNQDQLTQNLGMFFSKAIPEESTFICITHRLSNFQDIDRVFTLQNGIICEKSDHNTSMRENESFNFKALNQT